jgi:hypothetical protein
MRDRRRILVGLALFAALVTLPFWSRLAGSGDSESTRPELEYPSEATRCVEDTPYMTANHMDLLNQWRDGVVRDGVLEYTSTATGETFLMSLTKTCLDCHESRDDFCTRCHDYTNVEPTCWDCHVQPGGGS